MVSKRLLVQLDSSRKQLLVAAGWIALIVSVVFGLVSPTTNYAQSPIEDTSTISPSFEVASIKAARPGGGARMMFGPDGYSATGVTAEMLIQDAYGVDSNQIVGAPEWASSERYEIDAKMDDSIADQITKLSEDRRRLVQKRMLQSLLADRFKLTAHSETRVLPVYALIVAKDGPKLHEARPGDAYSNGLKTRSGLPVGPHMGVTPLGAGGPISVQGLPITSLVGALTRQPELGGKMVVDETGLKGNYDFTLQWKSDEGPALLPSEGDLREQGTANSASSGSSGPSLFTALEEQLGLKLEPQKAPIEILVIDHLDEPSAN